MFTNACSGVAFQFAVLAQVQGSITFSRAILKLAAVQTIVDDDQRLVDIVRRAEAAGGEARSAIASADAQLAEDEALLAPLQRDLNMARHRMAMLAGKSPAEWSAPDFTLASLTLPGAVPVSLPSELLRRRPDILAAEAELHAATAEIGVAVANQYPSLQLTGNLTQTSQTLGKAFEYGASGWSVMGGLTGPIFNGGTLKARRKSAEAEAQVAAARYRQTVLRAFVQVSDVLSALATDEQSIAALERAQRAAQDNANDAQTAYRLGGGALMATVDAQRLLSRAKRNLVMAHGQRYADFVELFTATAADWRTAPAG